MRQRQLAGFFDTYPHRGVGAWVGARYNQYMAQEFNASFIPKKEVQAKRVRRSSPGANIFLLIGVIIFLTSLLASLGVWLWATQLDAANSRVLQTLEKNRENYAIGAIQEFLDVHNRLRAADIILQNHIVVTPIFDILEEHTLTDIYLTNFSFAVQGNDVTIQARGYAPTYAHVALQADEYSSNNLIKELILSGVNQARDGGIQFDLSFSVSRDNLLIQ